MSTSRDEIAKVVIAALRQIKRDRSDITLEVPFFGDGLEMDSLDTAEFSAVLEDEFGFDPYSEGEILVTADEVVEFYLVRAGAAPVSADGH